MFPKIRVPSREWIHIPPNGKFGKSSTQNAHFLGGYVSFLEGTPKMDGENNGKTC